MTTQLSNIDKFKTTKSYKEVMSIVDQYRRVDDRIGDIEAQGYSIETLPMGSGGVGQVKEMSDHFRIQISYGTSRHNYAHAVKVFK